MNKVLVDADLKKKLCDLAQPLELCDETGRVLGRFLPTIDMSRWEPITPDVTDEELDRRAKSNEKRYTTTEMLQRLENL